MTIKEIEYRSGFPRASVRYYESEGLISPTRQANGYRDYSEEDLLTLRKIKLLRELDFSLEEIRALQEGKLILAAALQQRKQALTDEGTALERSLALCAQLQADGVTYATLEPLRYLPPPPSEPCPPSQPRFFCPWRRFFARMLDLSLCTLLFRLLRALLLGQSNLNRGPADTLAVSLMSMVLLLFLEPLFLRLFRTTPGKWVFQLRLSRDDGAPLGYAEALARTAKVLLLGNGLNLPLLGLIANALAYFRGRDNKIQPWEREDELYADVAPADGFLALRGVGLCVAAFILTCLALLGAESRVARLPYPSPVTVAQFSANYDHILAYANGGSVSSSAYLTPDGRFPSPAPNEFSLLGELPDFTYEVSGDGTLNAVRLDLEVVTESVYTYPGGPMVRALQALEGKSALFRSQNDPLYQRCQALLDGDQDALAALPDGGWHAELDYRLSGGFLTDSGLFFPSGDGTQRVSLSLRLSRVQP